MTNKVYYHWQDIEDMTSDIIQQIAVDGDGFKPDYVVGLTRGGLIPATMISHYFQVPMHTLEIKLRDHAVKPESNKWMAQDAVNGKKILIIDDINDSGATINHIKQHWQLNNLTFAVLINNTSSEAEVDYSCVEINKREDDVWIVFPWEDWWKWKK